MNAYSMKQLPYSFLILTLLLLACLCRCSFTMKESFHDHSYRPIMNPRNTYYMMNRIQEEVYMRRELQHRPLPQVAHVQWVTSSPGNCSVATISGIQGVILGFAFGMQYDERESGMCYQAWELFTTLLMDLKYTVD